MPVKRSLPLRAVQKSSVEEEVYLSLREAILSGQLWDRKLVQDELAASLGVSRIPVRTALKRLEHEHLVAVDDRGVYYAPRVSVSDLEEVYALRALVEPYATRMAVPRLRQGEIEELHRLVERMKESIDDPDHYVELNLLFHRVIYQAADQPRLLRLIDDIYSGIPPATPKTVPGQLARSLAEHISILSAIEAGDADAASALVEEHIRAAGKALIETMNDETLGGERHGSEDQAV